MSTAELHLAATAWGTFEHVADLDARSREAIDALDNLLAAPPTDAKTLQPKPRSGLFSAWSHAAQHAHRDALDADLFRRLNVLVAGTAPTAVAEAA